MNEAAERFRARSRSHRAAYDKTGGRCFYCGTSNARQLEHGDPLSQGGRTTPENCVLACGPCNGAKHTRTIEEFRIHLMIRDGRAPGSFFGENPRPERDWLILFEPKGRRPITFAERQEVKARKSERALQQATKDGAYARRLRAHLGLLPEQYP